MAQSKDKQIDKGRARYRVLDWGAGAPGAPCSLYYVVGGVERVAVAGDVVNDLPASAIGKPGQEDIRSFILGVHVEEVG